MCDLDHDGDCDVMPGLGPATTRTMTDQLRTVDQEPADDNEDQVRIGSHRI